MSVKAITIGILADTHVNHFRQLPAFLVNQLRELDLIIHLGDCETFELLEELNSLGDIMGVAGNHDCSAIREVFPDRVILQVNGKRLGLVHGHGCYLPFGLKRGLSSRFPRDNVDAILYGHTHVANKHIYDGILYFNPGSTAARFPARRPSYGILTIDETITGEVFYLDQVSSCSGNSSLQRHGQININPAAMVQPAARCASGISRFFLNGAACI